VLLLFNCVIASGAVVVIIINRGNLCHWQCCESWKHIYFGSHIGTLLRSSVVSDFSCHGGPSSWSP